MNTELIEKPAAGAVVDLGVADRVIAEKQELYAGLDAKRDYKGVVAAIADVRKLRVDVEKSRKELVADALATQRKVNGEAKRVTALLQEIEEPLKESKKWVDDEKAREKREKAEAEERERREAYEAEQAEKREAEEAERKRIADEQAAEREKLRIEREKLEKERAAEAERKRIEQEKLDAKRKEEEERLKSERDKLEAERREVEAEKARIAEEERKKQEAADLAKRQEEEKRLEAERVKRKAEEAEARKPDVEKLQDLSVRIRSIEIPEMKTPWGNTLANEVSELLSTASCRALVTGLEAT